MATPKLKKDEEYDGRYTNIIDQNLLLDENQDENNDENEPAIAPPPQKKRLAKSKDPSYLVTSVHLPKDLHLELKMAALRNPDMDVSDILAEGASLWLKQNS